MLSLDELKGHSNLQKVKEYIILLDKEYNDLIKEKLKVKAIRDKLEIDIADIKTKLNDQIIPSSKLALFEKFDATWQGKQRVAKSEIEEVVYAIPAVAQEVEKLRILEKNLSGILTTIQNIEIKLKALERTDDRISSIAKIEGLSEKIKYGMTVTKIGDLVSQ
jgi:hypothetical protein